MLEMDADQMGEIGKNRIHWIKMDQAMGWIKIGLSFKDNRFI